MNNPDHAGAQEAPKTAPQGDNKSNPQQGQGDNKQENSKPDQQQQK